MAFSNQKALKCCFCPLKELQAEKFFKEVPLKFEAASFEPIKFFLGKILFPNFTGSEPETEISNLVNLLFKSRTIHILGKSIPRRFQKVTVNFVVGKFRALSYRGEVFASYRDC